MTYAEAMRRYGSDKPDLRFDLELVDLTELLRGHAVPGLPGRVRRRGRHAGRRGAAPPQLDGWQEWASSAAPAGWPTCWSARTASSAARWPRTCPRPSGPGWPTRPARSRATRVLRRRPPGEARALLGAARLEIGRRLRLIDESAWRSSGWWTRRCSRRSRTRPTSPTARAAGRRCTTRSPRPSPSLRHVRHRPGAALAYAYDIVCNGNEIGGGSIRIHRAEMQQRVFDVIGLSAERRTRSSASCSTRSATAPPPHGGIAFGWDRSARAARRRAIRDVIAFPKSGGGGDPLTGAPTPITAEQRKEAGIDAKPA